MIGDAQPASTAQHRWRRIGWFLYLIGYCLMAGDYPGVGLVVFALGMLCHWCFWPLGAAAGPDRVLLRLLARFAESYGTAENAIMSITLITRTRSGASANWTLCC